MAQGNLIPTVVTDKNGKVTTVHKRGFKRTEPTMPAPSWVTVERERALADRVVAALYPSFGKQDDLRVRVLVRKLGEHATSFAHFVEKACRDSQAGHDYGVENATYIHMAVCDSDFMALTQIAKYIDLMPESMGINDMRYALNELSRRHDGDPESPEYLMRVRAHLYAATEYEEHSEGLGNYEENRALFDMVTRRPEDVEEIMRVHNTYKVAVMNDEVMEECLRIHPSIGQGIL
jgi:hypothetical protein